MCIHGIYGNPPFGFKSASAYEAEINADIMVIARVAQAGFLAAGQAPPAFTLNNRAAQRNVRGDAASKARKDALAKVVGYIPGFGTFMGLNRLIGVAADSEADSRKLHTVRGIIESLSIGIFLLPVDLVATAIREK